MKPEARLIIPAVALFFIAGGCAVDGNYTTEKLNDIDTDLTLFSNGLSIPLVRNTVDLKAGKIIDEISDPDIRDILKVAEDGKYEIRYSGHEDLGSFIDELDLADVVKIDAVDSGSEFKFELGDLDPDQFKSEPYSFSDEVVLPDLSAASSIKISPIYETITGGTGFSEKDFDLTVSVDPFKRNQKIFDKSEIIAAGTLSPVDAVSFPDWKTDISVSDVSLPAFEIPAGVKQINSVTLTKNARVVVDLALSNSVFTEGTITPDVVVDLSDLLSFGESGCLDLNSMSLDKSNGFHASKSFPISGVNLQKLTQKKNVSIKGSLSISGGKSTKAQCLAVGGDMGVDISISFPDLGVSSIVCSLSEIKTSISRTIEIDIDDIALPDEVEKVDYVDFTGDSSVSLKISAINLEKVSGLSLKADKIQVVFPQELVVSGDNVSGNVLSLSNVDLTEPFTTDIRVSRLNLPAPVKGKISYSPKVEVSADCTAGGTFDTADLKKLSGDDISVMAKVIGTLEVADFQAVVKTYKAEIPTIKGSISFDVPDKAASYGTITITPKGTPSITLNMTVPDFGTKSLSVGDGIRVKLPEFIVLGQLSYPELAYEAASNTLVLKKLKQAKYKIPIAKLAAKAEKTPEGSYMISGEYEVSGEVSFEKGTIDKGTLDKLSGAKLGFDVNVPSINAGKIAVDEVSFDVDESFDFDVLKAEDIPDMIANVGVVALDNVSANLGIDFEGMPSIGGSRFIVDLKAELPSFMKPSMAEIKGEIVDGKFRNEPIHIEGFDFSSFDLPGMRARGEGLKAGIKIKGSVYADKPEVDLTNLSDEVDCKVKVSISDPVKKITVKSVSARLDYAIDTTLFVDTRELNENLEKLDVNFDLPEITAVLGMRANLAVPASASLTIVPVKGKSELESLAITKDLVFPYSPTPEQSDTVTNVIALNLNDILNSKCDSLKLSVKMKTDKTKDCYVEPAADYSIGLGYDVSVPLRLGSEFKVEIADTLDLEGGLSGIEDILSESEFGIRGTIESSFPVGVKAGIVFLSYDSAKDVYSTIPLKPIEVELLKPNSESTFEIVTGPQKPGTEIPEITHIRINCVLTSDGNSVTPDSSLKIKDLSLIIPEGITVSSDKL